MAKRKKKRNIPVPTSPEFSNKPFAGLKLGDDANVDGNDSGDVNVDGNDRRGAVCCAPADEGVAPIDDAFSDLIDGVEPLTEQDRLAEKKVSTKEPLLIDLDDSELVMRHLDELVHGKHDFDIADTNEYIEAHVHTLDRRIVRKLRKGEFSIQAHLDLHGLRREEARQQVAAFLEKSHREYKRCVLIVHGRGLGSKDHIPVLKEKLRAWLTRGAMGKKVLAYASARPYDGGTGAVYVLLRA